MTDLPFDDDATEALLGGRPAEPAVPGVERFVRELRDEAAQTPPVTPSAALSQFVSAGHDPAVISLGRARVRRGVAAVAATTAGKLLLGVSVAAASLGGAHAVGVVDVPGLPDPGPTRPVIAPLETEESPGSHGDDVSDFVRTTDLEGCEKGQATADFASGNAAANRNNPDTDHDPCADDDDGDSPSGTHGQDVSDFVRSTDLEGCEKGQATADLASGNAAANRNNPDTDHDPCADDDTGGPDVAGNGDGNGNGRPDSGDNPGQGSGVESGDNPGNGGNPNNSGNPGNPNNSAE